jgi:hypothetical protein
MIDIAKLSSSWVLVSKCSTGRHTFVWSGDTLLPHAARRNEAKRIFAGGVIHGWIPRRTKR